MAISKLTNTLDNDRFDELLKIYHGIMDNLDTEPSKSSKKQFQELNEKAKIDGVINLRQKDAIMGRCSYQIGLIDTPVKKSAEQQMELNQIQEARSVKMNGKQSA